MKPRTLSGNVLSSVFVILTILIVPALAVAQHGATVEIVSPVAGNEVASCNALISTLNGITDASAAKRYIVLVEPGRYDCGDQTVTMQPYVDLRGSGIETTLLVGTGLNSLVKAASNSELRDMMLKVEAEEATDDATAIEVEEASPRLTKLKIQVINGAVCRGILNTSPGTASVTSIPYIRRVEIKNRLCTEAIGIETRGRMNPTIQRSYVFATNSDVNIALLYKTEGLNSEKQKLWDVIAGAYGKGFAFPTDTSESYGIVFEDTDEAVERFRLFQSYVTADAGGTKNVAISSGALNLKLDSSQVRANGGLDNVAILADGSTVSVNNASVVGTTTPIRAMNNAVIRAGASKVEGGSLDLQSGSSAKCAGVWNGQYTFFASTCP